MRSARLILRPLAVAACVAGAAAGVAALSTPATGAATGASVTPGARCYRAGQRVPLRGSGFLDSAPYDITVDGVDFGQSVTSASGAFSTSLIPGGIPAGLPQITDAVDVSDGSSDSSVDVTLTRATGALFGTGKGTSSRRRVPFEVWDFAPTTDGAIVYLHYVTPAQKAKSTERLGRAGGQCGYLKSKPLELFPFNPGAGTWTLQFDTSSTYSAATKGRVARIRVAVG